MADAKQSDTGRKRGGFIKPLLGIVAVGGLALAWVMFQQQSSVQYADAPVSDAASKSPFASTAPDPERLARLARERFERQQAEEAAMQKLMAEAPASEDVRLPEPEAIRLPEVAAAMADTAPAPVQGLNIRLEGKKQAQIDGEKGKILVTISREALPDISHRQDLVFDEKHVSKNGQSANITPGGDVIFDEQDFLPCVEIGPDGAEQSFHYTAQKSGPITLTAKVLLYSSQDCTGTPTSKEVSLQVKIDAAPISEKLWDKAIAAFLDFWGQLLALLVATATAIAAYALRSMKKKLIPDEKAD